MAFPRRLPWTYALINTKRYLSIHQNVGYARAIFTLPKSSFLPSYIVQPRMSCLPTCLNPYTIRYNRIISPIYPQPLSMCTWLKISFVSRFYENYSFSFATATAGCKVTADAEGVNASYNLPCNLTKTPGFYSRLRLEQISTETISKLLDHSQSQCW